MCCGFSFVQSNEELRKEIEAAVQNIKETATITRESVKKMSDDIQGKMDKQLAALKKEQEKQKLAEEV